MDARLGDVLAIAASLECEASAATGIATSAVAEAMAVREIDAIKTAKAEAAARVAPGSAGPTTELGSTFDSTLRVRPLPGPPISPQSAECAGWCAAIVLIGEAMRSVPLAARPTRGALDAA